MNFNSRTAIVGGFVRDLFLGISSTDIDIVIEHSLNNFIKNFSTLFHIKKVITHTQFKTATLSLQDGHSFDIAVARKEIYQYPGALPEVVFPASLEEDLKRRDFTLNSMALEITFGTPKLLDPYHGYDDIKNKILRTLHPLSFKDDPTRILRGIRFLTRLKFHFDPETEKTLKEAIASNCFYTISKNRILTEFFLILEEKNFISSLQIMKKYDILKDIDKNFIFYKSDEKFLKRTAHFFSDAESLKIEKKFLILIALFHKLPLTIKIEVFKNMNLSKKITSSLVWKYEDEKEVLDQLKKIVKNSDIFQLLEKHSLYFLFILLIRSDKKTKRKIRNYLFYLRKLPVIIDGKTLISFGLRPDENFKKILKQAFLIQMDIKNPTAAKILKELNINE